MMEWEESELKKAGSLLSGGQPEKALELLKELLHHASEDFLRRGEWRIHEMIGACFHDTADAEGAVQAYLRAAQHDRYLRCQREHFSNYLFALHYLPELPDVFLTEQHFLYGSLYRDAEPLPPLKYEKHRKLRIGCLAPDFLEQSAARFYEAMLTEYDGDRFEIYGYSLSEREDGFTDLIRASVKKFHRVGDISIEEAALAIQRDEIDILFDLGGHSAGGMTLQIMGYRPAPVQISGIGYFDTTGLPMMDYFLTDKILVPNGEEGRFSEQLLKLRCAFAFRPDARMKKTKPEPKLSKETMIFGCFNNFMKLNAKVLECFQRLLTELPEARLILQDTTGMESRRRQMKQRAAEAGLPMERVVVRKGSDDYLSEISSVDVMLDPWPYQGGGMTCTALYMGVPVISLTGTRHGSRFGKSLLHAAGLSELTADSQEDYIEKAVSLMRDAERRSYFRSSLREKLEASGLFDTQSWVRELEDMYIVLARGRKDG